MGKIDLSFVVDDTPPGAAAPAAVLPEDVKDWRVPCEVWSRIVGYLRPVQNWNAAKQQEFSDRAMFKTHEADI